MANLEIDDPVMVLLNRVAERFYFTNLVLTSSLASEDKFMTWTTNVHLLRVFVSKCNNDEASDCSLVRLMDNFATFVKLFEDVCSILEHWRVSSNARPFKSMLAHSLRDFSRLKKLVSQMTPAHVALQGHFKYLHFSGTPLTQVELRETCEILFTLRDEYFLKPRAGLLARYLVAAKAFAASEAYTTRGMAAIGKTVMASRFQAEIDRHAISLEVFSLMDPLAS